VKDAGAESVEYYVLFPNHHQGLCLHKRLNERDIKCTIAPTPREARNFCGISLKVAWEDLEVVKQVIADQGITIDRIIPLAKKKNLGYRSC